MHHGLSKGTQQACPPHVSWDTATIVSSDTATIVQCGLYHNIIEQFTSWYPNRGINLYFVGNWMSLSGSSLFPHSFLIMSRLVQFPISIKGIHCMLICIVRLKYLFLPLFSACCIPCFPFLDAITNVPVLQVEAVHACTHHFGYNCIMISCPHNFPLAY